MTAALAWTLVHFLWEGALIALILAVALWTVRGSSRMRYGLAAAAMLAMPLAFAATFALLLRSGPAETLLGASAAPGLTSPVSRWRFEDNFRWVVPVWIAGVLACYLRSLTGWMAAQRMRRVGVCDPPQRWRERLELLVRRVHVGRPVVLLESALAEVPVVIGVLRPVVLMPAALLAGLPVEQVEAILIHELAHIRRHDYLVNLAQSLVEGLLFYHPAVWWIGTVLRTERENCCDDTVIEISGDPRSYAAALASLEEIRCASREPALAATGGLLMKRIRRILRQPEARGPIGPALCAGAMLLLAVAVSGAWPNDPSEQQPPPPPPPPAQVQAPAQAPPPPPKPAGRVSPRRVPPPPSPPAVAPIGDAAPAPPPPLPAVTPVGDDAPPPPPPPPAARPVPAAPPAPPAPPIDGEARNIFIQGEVRRPGKYALDVPMTVLEALVTSGGFNEYANQKRVMILRGRERFDFNYKEVIAGKKLDQNIWVEPGDLIVVK